MASAYSMAIDGGDPEPIDVPGTLAFTREQETLNSSWLKITTPERFAAADQWELGARCELFLNDTRIFVGTFIDPTALADPKSQGRQYLIECPWRQFRRTPFTQATAVYADGAVPTDAPESMNTGMLMLGRDTTAAAQVQLCLDYLIADQAAHPDAGLIAISKGIIDAAMPLRPSKAKDVMTSEVVTQSCQFLQDAASWWDWTADAPAFNLRSAANMDVVTLPKGVPQTIKWQLQRNTEDQLAYATVTVRSQRQISGVNLRQAQGFTAPVGYAGPKFGGVFCDLDENDVWGLPIATVFASAIYNSSQNVGWKGQVTTLGRNINTQLRPGVVVNQGGGRSDYASMRAVVFKTVDDLRTGHTTAVFTPRKVLTVQALQAMLRQMWPPPTINEQTEQSTGQNPNANYGMGDHSDPASKNTDGTGFPLGTSLVPYDVIIDVAGVPTKKTASVLSTPPV